MTADILQFEAGTGRQRGRHWIENMDQFVTVRELLALEAHAEPDVADTAPLGRCPVVADTAVTAVWMRHVVTARWGRWDYPASWGRRAVA